jgi:hypothetical protein
MSMVAYRSQPRLVTTCFIPTSLLNPLLPFTNRLVAATRAAFALQARTLANGRGQGQVLLSLSIYLYVGITY